jgi:hypothetical protein
MLDYTFIFLRSNIINSGGKSRKPKISQNRAF